MKFTQRNFGAWYKSCLYDKFPMTADTHAPCDLYDSAPVIIILDDGSSN